MGHPRQLTWFDINTRKALYQDELKNSERLGELAGIIVIVLVVLFFIAHQMWNTGFFTSEFGLFEAALFYSAISFGMITAAVRALTGRRNTARPLEVAGFLLTAVFCLWFLEIYPFDFAHFGDVVPLSLGFLISWIPEMLVKVLLAIGAFGAICGAIYAAALLLNIHSLRLLALRAKEHKLMMTPFHQ